MLGSALSVLVLLSAAAAQHRLDLFEDDICKQQNGVLWTCKALNVCPKAQKILREGKGRPQMCNFSGTNTEPVVCCEPEVVPPPVTTSKSKQMCEKYAQSVFLRLPDPLSDSYTNYDTCALVEPLITNGKDAEAREYPHMALIGYGEPNNIKWLCGGTLISEHFVLSAGHCTDAGEKGMARWVRLGEYNVSSMSDDFMGLSQISDYEIIERINHPDYKAPSVYNDIALYRLNATVGFTEFIRPICLQTDHQFAKTYAIATGWGRTEWGGKGSDVLQKVNLTITSRKDCSDAYQAAISDKLKNGIQDISQLCAGDLENGGDTCQGDSGGPLQLRLKQPYCMYSQVGVTSFGKKCASNNPGVYTRVSHYVPWIESIVWP